MAGLRLTERGKDHILNGLVVISLGMLVVGVFRPTAPAKNEPSPSANRSAMRLEPINARQLPEFSILEEVVVEGSVENTAGNSVAPAAATSSSNVTSMESQPDKAGRQYRQVVNIPKTIDSILRIKLF